MIRREDGRRVESRGWSFPLQFDKHGPVMSDTELRDIEQDVKLLLQTLPGERIMLPQFGCDWLSVLFKTLTDDLRAEIKTIVTEAIMRNEPRVMVEGVDVTQDAEKVDAVHVHVRYRIAGRDVTKHLSLHVSPE